MKHIINLIKRVLMAFVVIYTLNFLLINVNLFIPINLFTVIVVTLLGIPGSVALVILSYIIS